MVTGNWGRCDPQNPKNRRTRTSLAIHTDDDEVWLIDAGPDLRQQLLREGIKRVHGVFLTHAHADHILGLDELRTIFNTYKEPIPVYGDASTLHHVRRIFAHLVNEGQKPDLEIYRPFLDLRTLEEKLWWKGRWVRAFRQIHGNMPSLGFHFGEWAYSTDVKAFEDQQKTFDLLRHTPLWFVDCIGMDPKPSHAHMDLTFEWIRQVAPQKAVLIHMGVGLDYDSLVDNIAEAGLPAIPAHDGMSLDLV